MRTFYNIYTTIFAVLFVCCLSSCQMFSDKEVEDEQPDNIKVVSNHFSDSHKYLFLDIDYTAPFYNEDIITADSIDFSLVERWANGDTIKAASVPKVKSYRYIITEKFDSIDFHPLLLVDLTLPQKVVDAERSAAEKLLSIFGENKLFISFIKGNGETTPTTVFSKYILSNNFVSDDAKGKLLYEAVLQKLKELNNATNEVGNQRYKTLIVMSDGAVWGDEEPYDPDHFEKQQELIDYYSRSRRSNMLYFLYFAEEDATDTNNNDLFRMFCSQSNGMYLDQYNWLTLSKDLAHKTYGDYPMLEMVLEFPDNRIFDGDPRTLDIQLLSDSVLAAKGEMQYWAGSLFHPIIVNGKSQYIVWGQGIILGLLLIALVYGLLQFVVPYVLYKLFRRKFVVKYAGANTTANGKQVADTCYYCKAPFEEGEMVVAKCDHAMHLECWEENDHHCPEYGIHCKEGSHFYNRYNLFDTRNTTYYTEWILLSIVAAILVWISSSQSFNEFGLNIVEHLYCSLNDMKWNSADTEKIITRHMANAYHLPSFTVLMGFFLTLTLGLKIVANYTWNRRILELLIRSVVAGIVSLAIYIFCSLVIIIANNVIVNWIFEWFPWIMLILGMAAVHTYNSRIRINMKWFLGTLCLSFAIMLIWHFVVIYEDYDYRLTILLCYGIFCVCYAVSIAYVAPKSEHYFFKVEGAIKTMDIALYKWFRSSPHRVVTVGKSVDCSLQMSWDINSDIAPVQMQVTLGRRGVYITPLEEGVYDHENKMILPEKSMLMRHGTKFRIGNTIFTYIEKD